ncbi:MAG: hypothetical protein DMG73_09720 [Acidobacteria bacterium]|nr:MAG: hypothetical protein DMG73_09720 [Acidobacteriota bacterium]
MDEPNPHRGITMHKIKFGGGVAGLTFTIGSMAIFLASLPQLWYFLAFAAALGIGIAAAPLGIGIAAALRIAHRRAPTQPGLTR